MKRFHGHSSSREGLPTPTYYSWRSMLQRCNNHMAPNFSSYGARGIQVCKEWLDFSTFLLDMGERPEGTELDRRDGRLGYNKKNCRWLSRREQVLSSVSIKNNTGLAGVNWRSRRKHYVVTLGRRHLGTFEDFFEACCRRKSAELIVRQLLS